jgi:hypothetical protein
MSDLVKKPSAWCICGKSDYPDGRSHLCRHADGPRWSAERQSVTRGIGVTHAVTHQPRAVTHGKAPMSGAQRQARYRTKDRVGYRRRHAAYMRTWRARRITAPGEAAA